MEEQIKAKQNHFSTLCNHTYQFLEGIKVMKRQIFQEMTKIQLTDIGISWEYISLELR